MILALAAVFADQPLRDARNAIDVERAFEVVGVKSPTADER
jgi:hypothetical protein